MDRSTTEIAIIGAGPSGAHLASRLAAAGRECVLFDPKGAWEKPCGGGVPTRALREFSFILEDTRYPRKLINRLTMISPLDRRVTVSFETPFAIYSRKVLNGLVLDRAIEAGARFVQSGVTDFRKESDGWILTTQDGKEWRARFLVGADGAASPTRRKLLGIFPKRDLALAFGYNVADEAENESNSNQSNEEVVIRFPRNFTGYLWAFPRPGVMNFGIFSKLGKHSSEEMRNILQSFIFSTYGNRIPAPDRFSFFGAKIPMLDVASWKTIQITGEQWALVGDAAGFADPITGEGIYYAIKSADILADSFRFDYTKANENYDRLCRNQFGRELEQASYRLSHFYSGKLMGCSLIDTMICLADYHRGVRQILVRALTGEQSYLTLKRDLLLSSFLIF